MFFRELYLNGPNRDDDAELYEIRADSPDGPEVVGLIVQGSTVEVLHWPGNGADAVTLAKIEVPNA
jgi:hypothetical protein